MYWSDKVAKQIIDSGEFTSYHVDDMKTLSGYPTIGSLRGPFVHDFVYKSLLKVGVEAKYTFIFNDFDPMDDLTEDLKEKFAQYMGVPLKVIPSPVEGFGSFADYYAQDFAHVLKELGIEPEYISSWELYHEGKFDEAIKEALDHAEEIQDIYQEVSGSQKKEQGWLPLQVICEKCGKLGTTKVHDWDGETVGYKCEPDLVKWAQGCGHSGRISPFGGNAKLPWKVDWPAHWKVLGVTIEGAGKDHSVKGGSRSIASEICNRVFHIKEPFNLPYDFFTIGGKKMSSSKGIGLKGRDILEFLPAPIARFLFSRTDYRSEIEFDPNGTMVIPDLFDEYDRCWKAYIEGGEEELARAFEMAQIHDLVPKEKVFLPRFRDVVNFMQQGGDLEKKFSEIKGSELSHEEKIILVQREKYGKVWLDRFAPDDFKFGMSSELPENAKNLTLEQKKYLLGVLDLLEQARDPEKLQADLYKLSQDMGLSAKQAFGAIYLSLIGKEFGPKAGQFLLQFEKEKVVERLKEAAK